MMSEPDRELRQFFLPRKWKSAVEVQSGLPHYNHGDLQLMPHRSDRAAEKDIANAPMAVPAHDKNVDVLLLDHTN